MIKNFTYNLVLKHDGEGKKGSRSRYQGGFIQRNGRSNNSSAYNHDYYMKNKEKWRGGRPVSDPEYSGTVGVKAFDMEEDPDYEIEGGMWYPHVDPYQPGYYIDWNSPDSVFYDYEKYTLSQFEKLYGDDAREVAMNNLIAPPYGEGQNNRVLYDDHNNRYYVMTTDGHAVNQLDRTNDVYNVNGQNIAFYTYEGRSPQQLQGDPFMREQAAKKLLAKYHKDHRPTASSLISNGVSASSKKGQSAGQLITNGLGKNKKGNKAKRLIKTGTKKASQNRR